MNNTTDNINILNINKLITPFELINMLPITNTLVQQTRFNIIY